jgi:protein CpxP
MKKMILFLAILFAGTVVVNAQGGFQRRTVEERVATAHQKLDSAFKLDQTKLSQADSVFTNFYKSTDKVRDEMMNGGQPDFQAMREKMQPSVDERDKKLQGILTEDQFKIFKDQIEPTLRPRRPGGGGNNR